MRCHGTVYRIAEFVLSGWQEDDLPQFSKIDDLIYIQGVAFILATCYHTVGIDHHYHIYVISSTGCSTVMALTEADSHPPVIAKVLSSGIYIALHYFILNTNSTCF